MTTPTGADVDGAGVTGADTDPSSDLDPEVSTTDAPVDDGRPSIEGGDGDDRGEVPVDDEDADPSPRPPWRDPVTWVVGLVVLFGVGVGIWLRYQYYWNVDPVPDSDESELGLMARQLLRGEFPLLMRNQPYGGSPFMFVDAISIRIFGLNVVGLRLPTVLLAVANAVLAFFIGRQVGWRPRRAALAAAGVWCSPIAGVYFTSRATMYFVPSITAGLVATLLLLRMERRRPAEVALGSDVPTRWGLVLAGFATGLGLWINPGSLYLTLPLYLWFGWRVVRDAWERPGSWLHRTWLVLRPVGLSVFGVGVGAFPWLFLMVFGVSRRNNYGDRGELVDTVGRAELFFTEQLPGFLGFKAPMGAYTTGSWFSGWIWIVGFWAMVALLLFQILRPSRRRNEALFAVLAASVPLVFMIISSQTGPLYVNLRYIIFASPVLGLVMAAKWKRDLLAAAAVATLPVVSLSASLVWHHPVGLSLDPVVELLSERGARCALGDYWAGGHRLMFASDEEIVTATTYENRNPLYVDQAEHLGNCPWIFVRGTVSAQQFEDWMTAAGIDFEEVEPNAEVVVYFPERRIWLDEPPPIPAG